MEPGDLLALVKEGGWGIAVLAIIYGGIERRERIKVQTKLDGYADKLPETLTTLVSETRVAIANFTAAANAILNRGQS